MLKVDFRFRGLGLLYCTTHHPKNLGIKTEEECGSWIFTEPREECHALVVTGLRLARLHCAAVWLFLLLVSHITGVLNLKQTAVHLMRGRG